MDTMDSAALDNDVQGKFQKSILGIKKLIKATKSEKPLGDLKPNGDLKTDGNLKKKKRDRNVRKKHIVQQKDKGLVYISHIPHGFYEHEMVQYFSQFGHVTNARVIRSKKTGKSKGCAFVEFDDPAVARVVADTTNNYLMNKRILKAVYVPPEKQNTHATRKKWTAENCPTTMARKNYLRSHNQNNTEAENLERGKKVLRQIFQLKLKLKRLGVDYDFFEAQDIPAALTQYVNHFDNILKSITGSKSTDVPVFKPKKE